MLIARLILASMHLAAAISAAVSGKVWTSHSCAAPIRLIGAVTFPEGRKPSPAILIGRRLGTLWHGFWHIDAGLRCWCVHAVWLLRSGIDDPVVFLRSADRLRRLGRAALVHIRLRSVLLSRAGTRLLSTGG
jgi:hypothetical protein